MDAPNSAEPQDAGLASFLRRVANFHGLLVLAALLVGFCVTTLPAMKARTSALNPNATPAVSPRAAPDQPPQVTIYIATTEQADAVMDWDLLAQRVRGEEGLPEVPRAFTLRIMSRMSSSGMSSVCG